MKRIAVIDDFQAASMSSADWDAVKARAEVTVFTDHVFDPDTLVERLLPFDAVSVMRERTKLPRSILERLPRLRFIGSTGAANAAIDMEAARDLGIVVSSTGGLGNGAPELTWALILAAARHLPQEIASMRGGGWQTTVGSDLAGKTLGILGLGNVGRQVAAVAKAFEMDVLAWSRGLKPEDAAAAGVRLTEKEDLLREADWVSLHLPLAPETRGLIGADELGMMKSSAWLVNAARGPLVVESALIDALRTGSIRGAALDVFDEEPLPADHPFRTMANVVASPHLGFVTEQNYRVFYGETVENLLAWMDERPVRTM